MLSGLPPEHLTAAAARLRPALAAAAQKDKALKRLSEQGWRYEREPDLLLTIQPSTATLRHSRKAARPYQVRATSCTCKGSFIHGCYHPVAWMIVAEALEPTDMITARVPVRQLVALLGLGLSTQANLLKLTIDSELERLLLGDSESATGTLRIDISPETRASMRVVGLVDALAVVRWSTALAEAADWDTVTIEVTPDSVVLTGLDGDETVWMDGADIYEGVSS